MLSILILTRMANPSSLHCSKLGVTTQSPPSRCVYLPKPTSKHTTCSKFCMSLSRVPCFMADQQSADLEMTVNTLIQIDKLVQLLESPVFTCKSYVYYYREDPS